MINVTIDTQTVEEAKHEVINQLKLKINHACLEAVCREQYGIGTIEGYECKNGDIVIDNNQVAFKLDFEVRFPISILINYLENYINKIYFIGIQPKNFIGAISNEVKKSATYLINIIENDEIEKIKVL